MPGLQVQDEKMGLFVYIFSAFTKPNNNIIFWFQIFELQKRIQYNSTYQNYMMKVHNLWQGRLTNKNSTSTTTKKSSPIATKKLSPNATKNLSPNVSKNTLTS